MDDRRSINDNLRLRLAVAITALKHKPKDLSIANYVEQLQRRFPLHGATSTEDALTHLSKWRERAAALADELTALKRKRDVEHAELLLLREAATEPARAGRRRSASPSSSAPAPKKAKRKKTKHPDGAGEAARSSGAICPCADDGAVLKALLPFFQSPPMEDTYHFLSAYRRMHDPQGASVSSATKAKIAVDLARGMGRLLRSTLQPKQPPNARSLIVALDDVLRCYFSNILASLVPPKAKRKTSSAEVSEYETAVKELTTTVISDLIAPIVRHIRPLSQAILSSTISPTKRSCKRGAAPAITIDIRRNLLAVLRRLLLKVQENDAELLSNARAVWHFTALTSARELASLWPDHLASSSPGSGSDGASTSSKSQPDRIAQLARKEAMSYLCSVLHHILDSCPPRSTSEGNSRFATVPRSSLDGTTLHAEVAEIFSSLLVKSTNSIYGEATTNGTLPMTSSTGMSEIEVGMVMAVLERAWLNSEFESQSQ